MKPFLFLLRLLIGGIFIYAGALKIYDPAAFAADIENYRLLPHTFVNLFAIVIPWVEVVTGITLVFGIWIRASAMIITFLLFIFLIGVIQAIARGLDIRCGCFGTVESNKIGLTTLGLELAMLLGSVWIWLKTRNESRLDKVT